MDTLSWLYTDTPSSVSDDATPEQLRVMASIELEKWEKTRSEVAATRDAAWSNYQDLRRLYDRVSTSVFRLELFVGMLDQEEFDDE